MGFQSRDIARELIRRRRMRVDPARETPGGSERHREEAAKAVHSQSGEQPSECASVPEAAAGKDYTAVHSVPQL